MLSAKKCAKFPTVSKEDAEKIAKEALVSQAWPQKKQLGVGASTEAAASNDLMEIQASSSHYSLNMPPNMRRSQSWHTTVAVFINFIAESFKYACSLNVLGVIHKPSGQNEVSGWSVKCP